MTREQPGWKDQAEARQALSHWVQRLAPSGWTWFVTLTFRGDNVRASTAVTCLKSWLSRWKSTDSPGNFCVWSVELQQRGAAHIHALMAGSLEPFSAHCKACKGVWSEQEVPWRRLNESWNEHYGFARFFPYDDSIGDGGAAYVVKYILADEILDWGILERGIDYGKKTTGHLHELVRAGRDSGGGREQSRRG